VGNKWETVGWNRQRSGRIVRHKSQTQRGTDRDTTVKIVAQRTNCETDRRRQCDSVMIGVTV
jgi:hypothetical protein